MADVQLEHGYTKIANRLLEEIAYYKFNGTEFRILMVIWRYTYGFNRKENEMSTTFIANAIGIDSSRVRKVLKKLIDKNVILVKQEATFNKSRVLSFNKNFEEWEVEKDTRGEKEPLDNKSTQPQGSKTSQPQGSKSTPKKESIKEIYKESNKNKEEQISASQFYEDNGFGTIGGYAAQMFIEWSEVFSDEILILAMKEAIENDAKHWKYLNRILEDWKSKNVKTEADARKAIASFRNRTNRYKNSNIVSIKGDHDARNYEESLGDYGIKLYK